MSKAAAMSPSDQPPADLLAKLPAARAEEAEVLIGMMRRVTGEEPVVWASRIIGFGQYHYRYPTGYSGTAPLAGFAPGAKRHTVYLTGDFAEDHPDLVARLGTFTHGKSCLYVKKLDDVDLAVLETLVEHGVEVGREADTGEAQ